MKLRVRAWGFRALAGVLGFGVRAFRFRAFGFRFYGLGALGFWGGFGVRFRFAFRTLGLGCFGRRAECLL